jgi:hypothetical protein
MSKQHYPRRTLSGRGDIQHVERIVTTLAPLIRQFVHRGGDAQATYLREIWQDA